MDQEVKAVLLKAVKEYEDLLLTGRYVDFIDQAMQKLTKANLYSEEMVDFSEFVRILAENFGLDYKYFIENDPNFNTDTYQALLNGLTTINWPHDAVPENAFFYMKSLKHVSFPSSLQEIKRGAFSNTGLTELDISNTRCNDIGNSAFAECPLVEIALPSTLKTIEDGVFSGTKISSITIPASVKKIGDWAFEGCDNLREVIFEGNPGEIEWGIAVFKDAPFRETKRYRDILKDLISDHW